MLILLETLSAVFLYLYYFIRDLKCMHITMLILCTRNILDFFFYIRLSVIDHYPTWKKGERDMEKKYL